MDRKELNESALIATLKILSDGRTKSEQAQASNATVIAVCDLIKPTLAKESHGKDYSRYSNGKLREELENRDLVLQEVTKVMVLLEDKAMDLDGLTGQTLAAFESSIKKLTSQAYGEVSHE
ncbi:hypothetical protein [Levilactobacillus andaensis]|uniref:hypothetical protein n=1 Tax=Levilactobacillus andaensis TaxID=2799570 RepID=UPI0019441FA0|nr:hypothetical protein [Levilactobacillus andaensis]